MSETRERIKSRNDFSNKKMPKFDIKRKYKDLYAFNDVIVNLPGRMWARLIKEIKYLLQKEKWKEQGVSKQSAFHVMLWDQRRNGLLNNAQRKNFRIATKDNLLRYKKSDRLYILGSGPSINDIETRQWDVISEHDSFAFNMFLAHPFVPTYYHMELVAHHAELFKECYLAKSAEFKARPMILNMRKIPGDKDAGDFNYIENLYVSIPTVFGGEGMNSREVFRHYYLFRDYEKENLLVHYRASLMIAVSFAILMGYKEIILAGVDMYSRDYFFYDENMYNDFVATKIRDNRLKEEAALSAGNSIGTIHRIADPTRSSSSLPVDKALLLLNDIVLKPKGINLYLLSEKTLLYPYLEVY